MRKTFMNATDYTVSTVVFLILGLFLLFAPNTSTQLIGTGIGIAAIGYGVLSIAGVLYARHKNYLTVDFGAGLIVLAFGIFMLINPSFLTNFLFIVLGVYMLIASISGIRRVLALRSYGYVYWWAPLVVAVLTLLLAISIITTPSLYGDMVMMVIGALLAVQSAVDLLSIYRLNRFIKGL